jgi:hypothetical protein
MKWSGGICAFSFLLASCIAAVTLRADKNLVCYDDTRQILNCHLTMKCEGLDVVEQVLDGEWELCNNQRNIRCIATTSSISE